MNAPFQSTLNPYASQYGTPGATAYGSGDQNPNPSPVSASASNPLGWADMNTYAPWTTPDGSTGSNPSFSGAGSWNNANSTLWNLDPSGLTGSMFGRAKKYNLPDISAPSYQGTLFDPGGNYLSSAGLSAQGEASNQAFAQQIPGNSSANSGAQGMNTNAQQINMGSFSGPSYSGASGLSSSQSYVGQNPYSVAGGNYVPGQSSSGLSYGGYSNYGGYGNSASGMQPYVPGQ